MSFTIPQRPLSYVSRLQRRGTENIDLVVIHCTELPDMAMARTWGEKLIYPETRTGNSGHFYIDRDGRTEQWVPVDHIAHHVRGHNPSSIGIELVNRGRFPDWFKSGNQTMTEPYPDAQVTALCDLLEYLETSLPGLTHIAGHEELDTALLPSENDPGIMIHRKLDPGPLFPWHIVMNKTSLLRLRPTTDEN